MRACLQSMHHKLLAQLSGCSCLNTLSQARIGTPEKNACAQLPQQRSGCLCCISMLPGPGIKSSMHRAVWRDVSLLVQGSVQPQEAADVARQLHSMGCYEVSLGDTIGVGTPASVVAMLQVRPVAEAGQKLASCAYTQTCT